MSAFIAFCLCIFLTGLGFLFFGYFSLEAFSLILLFKQSRKQCKSLCFVCRYKDECLRAMKAGEFDEKD